MTKFMVWQQFYTEAGEPKLRVLRGSSFDEAKAEQLRRVATNPRKRAFGEIEPVEVANSIAGLDATEAVAA